MEQLGWRRLTLSKQGRYDAPIKEHMGKLIFGTAGTPHTSATGSTVDGIKRVKELGLECLEIEFVMGVHINEPTARQIAAVARNRNIRLSVHAPYYINLNSPEEAKVKASQERLMQSARAAALCGAGDVVFHAAFYMGEPVEKVYENVKAHLAEVLARMKEEKLPVTLRPEIMGKNSQFGTLDEVFQLAADLDGVLPCIDFAHWHARSGKWNSYDEFTGILDRVEKRLGKKALDNMHFHVAGIDYGKAGEKSHLDLNDSDLKYEELMHALSDFRVGGFVICESPNLEDDALLIQRIYNNLRAKG